MSLEEKSLATPVIEYCMFWSDFCQNRSEMVQISCKFKRPNNGTKLPYFFWHTVSKRPNGNPDTRYFFISPGIPINYYFHKGKVHLGWSISISSSKLFHPFFPSIFQIPKLLMLFHNLWRWFVPKKQSNY